MKRQKRRTWHPASRDYVMAIDEDAPKKLSRIGCSSSGRRRGATPRPSSTRATRMMKMTKTLKVRISGRWRRRRRAVAYEPTGRASPVHRVTSTAHRRLVMMIFGGERSPDLH